MRELKYGLRETQKSRSSLSFHMLDVVKTVLVSSKGFDTLLINKETFKLGKNIIQPIVVMSQQMYRGPLDSHPLIHSKRNRPNTDL